MNDPEFKEMLKKAIFALSVALVFVIPIFFIFKNKLSSTPNEILKDIRNNKTFLLYVTKEKCNNCKNIRKELNNTKYKELNKDNNKDYNEIIMKLELNDSKLYIPALIYINKGKVESYIVDIKSKEDINNFLNNYK